jgi:putative intracellular protease/amidase
MGAGVSTDLDAKLKAANADDIKTALGALTPEALEKLRKAVIASKKVLIVATSASKCGDHTTGAWSEEICGPYYVFKDAGLSVTVCSIGGGDIPIDAGSLSDTFKTENDKRMETEGNTVLKGTPKLADQKIEDFDIVFFAGGHGTCIDFPTDEIGAICKKVMDSGKILAAVCHGPMCFAKAGDVVKDKKMACFSDVEEEQVKLTDLVKEKTGFLLEAKMIELGAVVQNKDPWSDNAVRDGCLVTGQNPQSSVSAAKLCIA